MLCIDGAFGEGGGQILRSSLALSMVTGKAFRMKNIRAGRRRPGLMRQHLTAVQAAQEICGGQVKGAEISSQDLEFVPGQIQSGEYVFRIGTAGSVTLVFQAILPALMIVSKESKVTLDGGTHNPMAPSYQFLSDAFFPTLEKMGAICLGELERWGFYPAGGVGIAKYKLRLRWTG